MRTVILLAMGFMLSAAPAFAGSIYKCNTQDGVVFSQTPCAPDAIELKYGKSKRAKQSTNGQERPTAGMIDIRLFDKVGAKTAEAIVELVGHPAAKYIHNGDDHWLYPNAVKVEGERRLCPELYLRDGREYQISWIPEDIMKKSVIAAQGFSDWKEPSSIRKKTFSVGDTVVMGKTKSQVVSKLGQPDAKNVFNGREIWEYKDVQFAANNPETLTIYLTFEGDIVASSAGN